MNSHVYSAYNRLRMNESEIESEIHTLRDGGNSHIIYAEEEAAGTRLLIGGRTCLLQNDHDPSKLVAETPCKLLRHLLILTHRMQRLRL